MALIEFSILGVPKNWSNFSAHRYVQYNEKKEWLETTTILGRNARVKAGCLPAEKGHDQRTIRIHQYRKRLLDKDGLYTSGKPIIDGLKTILRRKITEGPEKGKFLDVPGAGLIWNDDAKHCDWFVTQELASGRDQKITIQVEIPETV